MEIRWLPSALDELVFLVQNVQEMFGYSVALKVRHKITEHINLLSYFPKMGMKHELLSNCEREVRYLVNTPNIIFYMISDGEIVILSVLDSRQDPEVIRRMIADLLWQN